MSELIDSPLKTLFLKSLGSICSGLLSSLTLSWITITLDVDIEFVELFKENIFLKTFVRTFFIKPNLPQIVRFYFDAAVSIEGRLYIIFHQVYFFQTSIQVFCFRQHSKMYIKLHIYKFTFPHPLSTVLAYQKSRNNFRREVYSHDW